MARKRDVTKRLNSLDNILNSGHFRQAQDMILKMDIENAEWDILPYLSEKTLKRFRQMVFELHGLTNVRPWYHKKIRLALNNLNKTHQLVYVHANNCGESVFVEEGVRVPFFWRQLI